ncbi:MAG: DUF2845 domain-containing protein [Methylovulum sp.]|nr:DUF2845 domain-containing protein [Methylovulum sp.]
MKQSQSLFLLLCLLFSQATFALRCGHALVDLGDYKADVIDKCGEPESIETHIESRGESNFASGSQSNHRRSYSGAAVGFGQQHYVEIEVIVEEWIYDFGRRRLQQYLRFENGKLKEIKSVGRGD